MGHWISFQPVRQQHSKLPMELRQWVELWHGFLPEVHSFTSEEKARRSELPPFTHCTHSSSPFSDFLVLCSEDTLSLQVTWPVGIQMCDSIFYVNFHKLRSSLQGGQGTTLWVQEALWASNQAGCSTDHDPHVTWWVRGRHHCHLELHPCLY